MKRNFRKVYPKTRRQNHRGMVTLDYILVLGVTFPAAVLLFYWLVAALYAIYRFATLAIGWPYL